MTPRAKLLGELLEVANQATIEGVYEGGPKPDTLRKLDENVGFVLAWMGGTSVPEAEVLAVLQPGEYV